MKGSGSPVRDGLDCEVTASMAFAVPRMKVNHRYRSSVWMSRQSLGDSVEKPESVRKASFAGHAVSAWQGSSVERTGGLFADAGAEAGRSDKGSGKTRLVFKPTHQGECLLLLLSFDELIWPDNLVRFDDAVVGRLDLSGLIEQNNGGGASAYNPATLLRI